MINEGGTLREVRSQPNSSDSVSDGKDNESELELNIKHEDSTGATSSNSKPEVLTKALAIALSSLPNEISDTKDVEKMEILRKAALMARLMTSRQEERLGDLQII